MCDHELLKTNRYVVQGLLFHSADWGGLSRQSQQVFSTFFGPE